MKIKNSLNAHEFPYLGRVITQPSMTVPDQSLTIREIMDRYARGLPLDIKTPQWDENADLDDILPDPRTMDISERAELALTAKQELAEIKTALNKKAQKKPIIEPEIIDPPAQLEN